MSGNNKLPGNWKDFLCDSSNKKELFSFLANKIKEITCPSSKAVYITSGQSVLSMGNGSPVLSCNHEEAGTRLVVHVLHALEHGNKAVLVRTVDIIVIAILVGMFHDLIIVQLLAYIWVAFCMGKNYRFYSIKAICASLREPRSRALTAFHSFSGCDTTSAFNGKGKKSAW